MTGHTTPAAVVRSFVEAFARADLAALRALFADDFVGHVTTADGGTREASADAYVSSVEQMDVPTAALQLELTDLTEVDPDTVLVMVEVHAERGARRLRNFSGQLLRVRDGRITELWMVDAKPAESDAFWATG